MELFQTEIRCLQIARVQDFAPNTPELLGALSGPQTPGRKSTSPCEVGDSLRESNPPSEISAYGHGKYVDNKKWTVRCVLFQTTELLRLPRAIIETIIAGGDERFTLPID